MAEHRHWPAAPSGQSGHGIHVDRIDVRTFFPVDFHVHEAGVHRRRDLGVLEALVGHDVAPVAGRVADAQQDGNVTFDGRCYGLRTPRIPVHRIISVLTEVGAGLAGEEVHPGDATDGVGWRSPVSGPGRLVP